MRMFVVATFKLNISLCIFRDLFLIVCFFIQEDVCICLEGFTDTLRSAYYAKILYGYIAYFSYGEDFEFWNYVF